MKTILCFSVLFLGLFSLSFLQGCKKNKDQHPPQIAIELPEDNESFSVNDPIPVRAFIRDNKIIESVEVSLYSTIENRKVGKTMSFRAGGSAFQLEMNYVISDTLLPSGSYYIRIHAYDGNNIGYAFRNININGLARKRLYTLLVSSTSSSTLVSQLSTTTISPFFTFGYSTAGAAMNSLDNLLYLGDKSGNNVRAFDIVDKSSKWTVNYPAPTSTPVLNWLTLGSDGRNVAVSLQNGYTELLSPQGVSKGIFTTELGMNPLRHFAKEKFTFIETLSNSRNEHQLEIFYTATAGTYDKLNIAFEVVDVFVDENGDYDLIVNENGQSWLLKYSVWGRNLTTKTMLLNSVIKEVVQITKNEFLLSSGSSIQRFSKRSGSTFPYISGMNTTALAYDPLLRELFVAVSGSVHIYDYSSGNEKINFPVSADVNAILPVYNY